MNYALDALWWRLRDPDVRALASILTAPALWQHAQALPIRTLLGEHGFRYLLALDNQPEPLHHALAQSFPHQYRLGFYAESLLHFWLSHAPHCRLLAHNLQLIDEQQQTLGALDFVAHIGQTLYHVELCCKYYGGANMVGFNQQDQLSKKATKLQQQLAWSQHPLAQEKLRALGIETHHLHTASIIRGTAFLAPEVPLPLPLNPYCWQGHYVQNWADYPLNPQGHYHIFRKMRYLAPARVAEAQCHTASEVVALEQGMVAVLEQRPDGYWHEVARIMKVSPEHKQLTMPLGVKVLEGIGEGWR